MEINHTRANGTSRGHYDTQCWQTVAPSLKKGKGPPSRTQPDHERQVHWDLVIVDEAHRMSARVETHQSQRYKLGEWPRDSTDHVLPLTAAPHKGDPQNFTLFLATAGRGRLR